MRVTLGRERLTLDDSMLLGQGGEARVYRHPHGDLALKVYTAPDPSAAKADHKHHQALMKLRAQKITALVRATSLPSTVVRPTSELVDDKGELVGYAMPIVKAPVELAALARADRTLDANGVMALFAALLDAVTRVHHAGIVIGDLNDANVLLAAGDAPLLIDTDSWQVGALPCPVAHERFLDPRLFGIDLARACRFSPLSDAYALRVMLFQSLLFVHPYGGVHAQHGTLLRRAEARHSVLRGDVKLPRRALSPDTLPDALRDDFERAFDRDERAPLALPAVRFVTCTCGAVHGRAACPLCRVVVQKPAVRIAGTFAAETIAEARTAVLHACMHGGRLAFLIDDDGVVRREDRAVISQKKRGPRVAFGIAADRTWVERDGELSCFVGDRELTATDRVRAHTWCTSHAGLFFLDGDSVLHHETRARVARVLPNITRLFGSPGDTSHAGMLIYRAGDVLRAAWFGRGVPTDVDALPVTGRVAELCVSFGDERALIGVALDDAGVRTHALYLIDARGRLLASARGRPDEALLFGAVRGFALAHGKVLAPTHEGVLAFDAHAGAFVERARFSGTEGFVDASCELLPAPGGELIVVDGRSIVKLRMVRS